MKSSDTVTAQEVYTITAESLLGNLPVDPTDDDDDDLSKSDLQQETDQVGQSENIQQCSDRENASVPPIASTESHYTPGSATVDPLSEPHRVCTCTYILNSSV